MKAKLWILGAISLVLVVAVVSYAERDERVSLPKTLSQIIGQLFPGATIDEVQTETEGIKVYEAQVKLDGSESEVTIAEDGTVIEILNEASIEDFPETVRSALTTLAGSGTIKEVFKETEYYAVVLQKLDVPKVCYEAEILTDDGEMTVELAANGTLIEKTIESGDEDQDHQNQSEDEDDDEEVISLDQVPGVVKTAILAQAQDNEIREIVLEEEDGQDVYEAEIIVDGKEVDFKFAANGQLLDDDDEDEDEDDD